MYLWKHVLIQIHSNLNDKCLNYYEFVLNLLIFSHCKKELEIEQLKEINELLKISEVLSNNVEFIELIFILLKIKLIFKL